MPRRPPLHKQLGVSKKEVRKYGRVIRKRFKRTEFLPTAIGLVAAAVFLVILLLSLSHLISVSMKLQASGKYDNTDRLETLSMLAWGGCSIFFGILLPIAGRDLWVTRILRRHITEPRCIHCGYDLKGLANSTANHITCPECGKDSPRIASTG